jgi:hypothetical protein
MVNPYNINPDVVKQYIRDKLDGKNPTSPLPADFQEPPIPTKEEFEQKVKQKIPSEAEIDALVSKRISGKIPNVPYVNFIPPTTRFSSKTNILIDPFINAARIHLMSRGGTMMVMAQYPPPAPPAPAILMWQGYNVRTGPPIPPLLPKFPIPLGLGKFLKPEKGAKDPEEAQKELEEKLNPPETGSVSTTTTATPNIAIIGGVVSGGTITGGSTTITQPNTTNTVSVTGGQTITDNNAAQNNIKNNKC